MAKKKPIKEIQKVKTKKIVKELISKVTDKKIRGRKPGVKVGPYKKKNVEIIKTEINDSIANNPISDSLSNNDTSILPEINPQPEPANTKITSEHINTNNNDINISSNNSNDENILNKFVEENKSKVEFKEVETKPDEKNISYSQGGYQPDNISFNQGTKQLISGALLLSFCDFIFPTVILKLMIYFDPSYSKIDKQDIKLDAGQKKDLEPAADIVAAYVFQKVDPMAAFFIALTICYASNFTTAIELAKEREKNKIINTELQNVKERIIKVEKEADKKFKNKVTKTKR